MDKKVIFFLVELWSVLAYTHAENEHKVEHVSIPSRLPQVLFEMKLIKHELMSLGNTINDLENRLNNLGLGTTMNGLENRLSDMGERLETLEAKCTDNVAEIKYVRKSDFQELKEEMILLKKGFSSEKQSLQKKVKHITQDMSTSMTELRITVNQTITDKQDQLDYKFERFTADTDKTLKETKDISTRVRINRHIISDLSAKLDRLNNDNLITNSSNNKLLAKLERQEVAFSAYLGEITPELPAGSTIVFDEVVYQTGGGYNPQDGVFTCPESGVYFFNFAIKVSSLSTTQPQTLTAGLYVDGHRKATIVSESQHNAHDDQASNLVILYVLKGQTVLVKTFKYNNVKSFPVVSTFSGALLYA